MLTDGTRGASSSESRSSNLDDQDLYRAIDQAAWSVYYQWPGVFDHDDMVQELWVWQMERPAAQAALETADAESRHKLLVRQGHLIASGRRERNALFSGLIQYSVHDVVDMLTGVSDDTNGFEDLGTAMQRLEQKNPAHADLIRFRYGPGEREPMTSADRKRLERARDSLTDEMNREARRRSETAVDNPGPGESLGDGPGTRRIVLSDSMLGLLDEDTAMRHIESEWQSAKERMADRPVSDRPKPPDIPLRTLAEMQVRDPLYPFNHRY